MEILTFRDKLKWFEKAGGAIKVEDCKRFLFFKTTKWHLSYKERFLDPIYGQDFVNPSIMKIVVRWMDRVVEEGK